MHVYTTRTIPPGFELQERLKLVAAERPHLARFISEGAEYEERTVGPEPREQPPEVVRSAPPVVTPPLRVAAPAPPPPPPPEPAVDYSADLLSECNRRLAMSPTARAEEDARKAVDNLFPEPPSAA